jgi:hypothetical protein
MNEHDHNANNSVISERNKDIDMQAPNPGTNFPIEAFPLLVRQIITATNESLNFPIDFIGASMLYASSVAIGNTHRVEIKKGFQESAVLYLAIVARAGTNKSHPLSFALQPIIEQDKKTYAEYVRKKLEYDKLEGISKQKAGQPSSDQAIKPIWLKYIVSDFTPEALSGVHKTNKRGIGVYVDELAGWFKNFDRYNKGSAMEFWLSAWSGKQINIDRKTGEPVFIPMPFIPVVGTIQTGLLDELAKESRTQNGFLDRILFVVLDNLQKQYWSESEIAPITIENWSRIVSNLLNLPFHLDETLNPKPEILHFSPEAKQLLFEWQRVNTNECRANSEAIAGIYSKMDMYVGRLALILQLLQWACDESDKQAISIESVKGAIQLVEYFKEAAVKVHAIISNASSLDSLPANKKAVYMALPDSFTTKIGLQVAISLKMPERNFKRFIQDEKKLFVRVKHGEYKKCVL